MTIHQLPELRYIMQHQLTDWRRTSKWWLKGSSGLSDSCEGALHMRAWCKIYIKFYIAVTKHGKQIEECFLDWVNDHTRVTLEGHTAYTDVSDAGIRRAAGGGSCSHLDFSAYFFGAKKRYTEALEEHRVCNQFQHSTTEQYDYGTSS